MRKLAKVISFLLVITLLSVLFVLPASAEQVQVSKNISVTYGQYHYDAIPYRTWSYRYQSSFFDAAQIQGGFDSTPTTVQCVYGEPTSVNKTLYGEYDCTGKAYSTQVFQVNSTTPVPSNPQGWAGGYRIMEALPTQQ